MEKLSRGLLAFYILMLIWLVFFKLQFDISSVINRSHRSVNLVLFAHSWTADGRPNYSDIIFNFLFFIPFGVLLSVVFKHTSFIIKFLFIFLFSLTAEITQYIFRIGVTDITDLISNSFGGLVGLVLYLFLNSFIKARKLDRLVLYIGIILLLLFLGLHVSHYFRRTAFN